MWESPNELSLLCEVAFPLTLLKGFFFPDAFPYGLFIQSRRVDTVSPVPEVPFDHLSTSPQARIPDLFSHMPAQFLVQPPSSILRYGSSPGICDPITRGATSAIHACILPPYPFMRPSQGKIVCNLPLDPLDPIRVVHQRRRV